MNTEVQELVLKKVLTSEEIVIRTREIYDSMLQRSEYLDEGNFTQIHPDDLENIFDHYDSSFFDGGVRNLLGEMPLHFRLSQRMTQAGGKTSRIDHLDDSGKTVRTEYEIAVSTTLLFQTFQEDHRPILMSGIPCHNRLEALQRVMEHEMIHLIEMLLWVDSSCSAYRFQSIANRFFGHTDSRHQLLTPRERAFTKFGIKVGDRVFFELEGQRHYGVVNRITKRATVLVEAESGQQYSDGKCYRKFYVPLGMLRSLDE